jgi:FkbM family methyltransferase
MLGVVQRPKRFVLSAAEHFCPRTLLRFRARRHLRWGEPELRLVPALSRRDRPSVDVGANCEVYSFVMAQYACGVHAFEPNPRLAELLRRSLPENRTVHECALSSQESRRALFVPRGSLHDDEGRAYLTSCPCEPEGRYYEVLTRRLDECVTEKIGLLKIDVEGHELDVLMGAVRHLENDGPNIIIEAEERHRPDAVQSVATVLVSLGYIGGFYKDGRLHDLAEFDLARDQNADLMVNREGKSKPPGYINNFVFTRDTGVFESLAGRLS